MNSSQPGYDISTNDGVTNISTLGFWILIDGKEYFIPFSEYPVFKRSTIEQICCFQKLSPKQLYWKELDCDIEIDSLENPKNFPLTFRY